MDRATARWCAAVTAFTFTLLLGAFVQGLATHTDPHAPPVVIGTGIAAGWFVWCWLQATKDQP